MPDKFGSIAACSHLFEINFGIKTAQISGFQMENQWV
jgi:hypothetical protein